MCKSVLAIVPALIIDDSKNPHKYYMYYMFA